MFTLLICLVILVISIVIWNLVLKTANSSTNTALGTKLISGLSTLEEVADNENLKYEDLKNMNLSKNDIKKILEYKKFKIYRNEEDKYFVFFTKNDYSMKEQIIFWFKVLLKSPKDIVKSYVDGYNKMVFISEKHPIYYGKENHVIPMRIYKNKDNVIDVNPNYEKYISPYYCNNIKKNTFFSENVFLKIYPSIMIFTKINLVAVPFVLIVVFLVYIIFRKKISLQTKGILELIIIMYSLNFINNMADISLSATIDRYMVRFLLPMYIADILLVGIIFKRIYFMFKEKFLKNSFWKKKQSLN